MAIVTCPHSGGMGMCGACAAEVQASMDRDDARARRREKLERMIRDLKSERKYAAARELERELEKL
jgi:hypothetical protein